MLDLNLLSRPNTNVGSLRSNSSISGALNKINQNYPMNKAINNNINSNSQSFIFGVDAGNGEEDDECDDDGGGGVVLLLPLHRQHHHVRGRNETTEEDNLAFYSLCFSKLSL